MTTNSPRKCDSIVMQKFSAGKYYNIKYCGSCGFRQEIMSANYHDVHELLDKCPVDECNIVLDKEDAEFISLWMSCCRNRKRKRRGHHEH